MVASDECTPIDGLTDPDSTVVLTMPLRAWLGLRRLAAAPTADKAARGHLRRAIGAVTQVDSVVHVAVMIRGEEVEAVSVHTHRSGAEGALISWLRRQPDLWGSIEMEDWQFMQESGLVPLGIGGSTTLTVPIGTKRGGGNR